MAKYYVKAWEWNGNEYEPRVIYEDHDYEIANSLFIAATTNNDVPQVGLYVDYGDKVERLNLKENITVEGEQKMAIEAKVKGRYVYYQPNEKDLKDEFGDCQVRALSKALGITWVEAFDLTIPICREMQTYTIFGGTCKIGKENLEKLGFTYTGISNKKGTKRPTVDSFAKAHPKGTYIAKVAHHVVAIVDGKYYDTWDSGWRSMYGYYTKVGA